MKDLRDIIVVTDVDGTFLGKKSEPVARNTAAAGWLISRGGGFTLSTGRMPAHIRSVIPNAGSIVNLPCIACNGTMLADIATGEVLSEHPLPYEFGRTLVEFIASNYPEVGIRLSVPEGFVTTARMALEPRLARDLAKMNRRNVVIEDLSGWGRFKWYKFVVRGEPATLDGIRDSLCGRFPGLAVYSKSGPAILEVQTFGATKGTMLAELKRYAARQRGLDDVTAVCLGDYENDLDMLKAADISVCPANAIDSVKEVCDLCLCDNSEGVIAAAVEYIAARRGLPVSF